MFYIQGYNPSKDRDQYEPEDDYHLVLIDNDDKEFLKKLARRLSNPPSHKCIYFGPNLSSLREDGKDVDSTEDTTEKNLVVHFMTTDSKSGKLLLHKIYTAIDEWRAEADVPLVSHCTEAGGTQSGPFQRHPSWEEAPQDNIEDDLHSE